MPYLVISCQSLADWSSAQYTVVGNASSNRALMIYLDARIDYKTENYQRYAFYFVNSGPREVLDRLEVIGYRVVCMASACVSMRHDANNVLEYTWTLHGPPFDPASVYKKEPQSAPPAPSNGTPAPPTTTKKQ
ncbi:GTP cyclohydrolase 1 feedback regulatory protein-like [Paramacrobiotus metropolitanus]|uniref:GTP cyclohydrolase 1 feedback regulatory protein-like n=1 Tax=Paramacrobiotus metropolitanus TaxID=2943436 RepID=UPI00244572E4|nr:GTP cyclohydrolase 1 feedback regulatory protein-like [Paramacrobiotus metropolitanus]